MRNLIYAIKNTKDDRNIQPEPDDYQFLEAIKQYSFTSINQQHIL